MSTVVKAKQTETKYGMQLEVYVPTETAMIKLKEEKRTKKIKEIALVIYKRNLGILHEELYEINMFDYKNSLEQVVKNVRMSIIENKPQVMERKNIGVVMWDEEGGLLKSELQRIGYKGQAFEPLNIEPVVTKKLLCLKNRKMKIEEAARISSMYYDEQDDSLKNAKKIIKIEEMARNHWEKRGREKVYTYELSQDIYKKRYNLEDHLLIKIEQKMNEVNKIDRETYIQGELQVGETEKELIEIMSERVHVNKRKDIKMRDIVIMKYNYPKLYDMYKNKNEEFLIHQQEVEELKERFELLEKEIASYYYKRTEQCRMFLMRVLDTKREIERAETLEVMNFKKEDIEKMKQKIEEVERMLSFKEHMIM